MTNVASLSEHVRALTPAVAGNQRVFDFWAAIVQTASLRDPRGARARSASTLAVLETIVQFKKTSPP